MARGGARPGAGRPKGSSNKKRAADKATEALRKKFADVFDEDILNEDAIDTVEYARMVFRQDFKDTGDIESLKAAVSCARDSLPYKLPKLTANKTDLNVTNPMAGLTEDDLQAILRGENPHADAGNDPDAPASTH